jgi:hypothetical protein
MRKTLLYYWRAPMSLVIIPAICLSFTSISMFLNTDPGPFFGLFGLVVGVPSTLLVLRLIWMIIRDPGYLPARWRLLAVIDDRTPEFYSAYFRYHGDLWKVRRGAGGYALRVMEKEDVDDALLLPMNESRGMVKMYQIMKGVWPVFKWVGPATTMRDNRRLVITPDNPENRINVSMYLADHPEIVTTTTQEIRQLTQMLIETRPQWKIELERP